MLDGFTPNGGSSLARPRELCLFDTRVKGLEGLEKSDKLRRQPAKGFDLRNEKRVSAGLGLVQKEKRGETGRLALV